MAEDTEMLLALLSSMIEGPIPSEGKLLTALIDADGDVHSAATKLNRKGFSSGSKGTKRKRIGKLDGWIVNKKRVAESNGSTSQALVSQSNLLYASDGTQNKPITIPPEGDEDSFCEAVANSSTSPSKTKAKPTVDLMSILKQAPSPTKSIRFPTRMLGTPSLIAQHTPCTMHYSILPPELACRLFYAMLEEATGWSRNKWWLFDRLVESLHRTSFYARNIIDMTDSEMQEAAKYWYNGRPTPPPPPFLPEMEEACEIIEKTVNQEIQKRGRKYPMEWPSTEEYPWKANVAASNCYTGSKETVGFHSDQLTYLGPCPTIASLSLGATRKFRLREVVPQAEKDERSAQTFDIPVVHNSLLIMHASCQERFKHCVPPQQTIDAFHPPFPPPQEGDMMDPTTSRINITFRFYRPDFAARTIPRCHCGIPTVLRPDMKRRQGDDNKWDEVANMRYFWMCYAGAQNDGKGCKFFQVLDFEKEGRGNEYVRTLQ